MSLGSQSVVPHSSLSPRHSTLASLLYCIYSTIAAGLHSPRLHDVIEVSAMRVERREQYFLIDNTGCTNPTALDTHITRPDQAQAHHAEPRGYSCYPRIQALRRSPRANRPDHPWPAIERYVRNSFHPNATADMYVCKLTCAKAPCCTPTPSAASKETFQAWRSSSCVNLTLPHLCHQQIWRRSGAGCRQFSAWKKTGLRGRWGGSRVRGRRGRRLERRMGSWFWTEPSRDGSLRGGESRAWSAGEPDHSTVHQSLRRPLRRSDE
jgi:hypothetical protein